MTLAQATDTANTLLGLTVMEWTLLLTTLGAGLAAFLKWLDARASKIEAHQLALAKLQVEQERDAAFVGVERGADARTKLEVRAAAKEAGLGESDFAAKVKKATTRLAPLLLAVVLLFTGCTGKARQDAETYAEINRAHATDKSLSFDARAIAQDNHDAWAVQAWELGGDEPSAEVLRRVSGTPVIAPPVHPDTPGRSQ